MASTSTSTCLEPMQDLRRNPARSPAHSPAHSPAKAEDVVEVRMHRIARLYSVVSTDRIHMPTASVCHRHQPTHRDASVALNPHGDRTGRGPVQRRSTQQFDQAPKDSVLAAHLMADSTCSNMPNLRTSHMRWARLLERRRCSVVLRLRLP